MTQGRHYAKVTLSNSTKSGSCDWQHPSAADRQNEPRLQKRGIDQRQRNHIARRNERLAGFAELKADTAIHRPLAARASRSCSLPTVFDDHWPPVALWMPRRFNSAAICRADGKRDRSIRIGFMRAASSSRDRAPLAVVRTGTQSRTLWEPLFLPGRRPLRFHKGLMNILSGYFDQPDDWKIGLVEKNAHGLKYAPGSTQTPAVVTRASFNLRDEQDRGNNGFMIW